MKWLLLLALLGAPGWFGSGGLSPWPTAQAVGQVVTLEGRAENAKLGAVLIGSNGPLYTNLDEWPAGVEGHTVVVRGKLVKQDQPVVSDPHVAGLSTAPGFILSEVVLVRR